MSSNYLPSDLFLKSARSGDPSAIADLIEHYDPTMKKFARRLCSSGEDAEDSVQHARVVITTKLNQFREISKVSTWLFAIIKNECHRLQKKMFGFALHGPAPEALLSYDEFEEDYERREIIRKVSRCIEELDVVDRSLIVGKDVEGKALEALAEESGLSIEAVKSRLHRSRKRLKDRLAESRLSPELG